MAMNVNLDIKNAKAEFLTWWTGEKLLGEDDYEKTMAKVIEAAKGIETADITLHYQIFRRRFSFYYGEKMDQEKYIPISASEGKILRWQTENGGCKWPIKNPETKSYFIPNITLNKIYPPFGGIPTDQYLESLAKKARYSEKDKRILEALTPYKKEIFQACGLDAYNMLTSVCPKLYSQPKEPS